MAIRPVHKGVLGVQNETSSKLGFINVGMYSNYVSQSRVRRQTLFEIFYVYASNDYYVQPL